MSVRSTTSIIRILGGITSTAPQALVYASTLQKLVDLVAGSIRAYFKPILVEHYNL